MSRITWGDSGFRTYESGVDRGVFYPRDSFGVPWNGLTSISEKPTDFDVSLKYVDGVPYQARTTPEGFAATIDAYTYPLEFSEYDGVVDGYISKQRRKPFGFSYRTKISNDLESDQGYKIHLVYNALASPSDTTHSSMDDSAEPTMFSWDITTTPIPMSRAKASSHLIIDSTKAYPWTLKAFEDLIYGSDTNLATLPSPEEVFTIFEVNSILIITDHGDGTWSAEGPDDVLQMIDDTTFEIAWASAVYIDAVSYNISSL